jgi:hypothetical protein
MFTVVLITFDMRWMQALIFPSTLPLSPTASSMDSSRERQAEKERDREANASQLSVSQTILPSAEKSLLHSSSVISNSGPATIGSDGPDSTKNDNSSGRSYFNILCYTIRIICEFRTDAGSDRHAHPAIRSRIIADYCSSI